MEDNVRMYAAMQEGTPVRTWIKTILGKVYVAAWDSFTEQPTGLMLEGDPKKFDESSMLDIWGTKEDLFFKNSNKTLISKGIIKEIVRTSAAQSVVKEDYSDEELLDILGAKFLAYQAKVNKITSIPVLFRMEALARENEKSDKVIGLITARISELQSEELE